MTLGKKPHRILRWTARLSAAVLLLSGLPFYLGYGNPLPFSHPDYLVWDNIWLTAFPLVFIGLGLGWKMERTGGYLITLPVAVALVLGYLVEQDVPGVMFLPLAVGILYLWSGYSRERT